MSGYLTTDCRHHTTRCLQCQEARRKKIGATSRAGLTECGIGGNDSLQMIGDRLRSPIGLSGADVLSPDFYLPLVICHSFCRQRLGEVDGSFDPGPQAAVVFKARGADVNHRLDRLAGEVHRPGLGFFEGRGRAVFTEPQDEVFVGSTPQHMLPASIKAMPPNIFRSVNPFRRRRTWRTRSATDASNGMSVSPQ